MTKSANIKIGDFGIAREFNDDSDFNATTYAGTHKYMSPEILDNYGINNLEYDYKTDCWSIGCTLYELITLNVFFDSIDYSTKEFESNAELNILNELLRMFGIFCLII